MTHLGLQFNFNSSGVSYVIYVSYIVGKSFTKSRKYFSISTDEAVFTVDLANLGKSAIVFLIFSSFILSFFLCMNVYKKVN